MVFGFPAPIGGIQKGFLIGEEQPSPLRLVFLSAGELQRGLLIRIAPCPRQVHPPRPRSARQHPEQRLQRAARAARAVPGARGGAAQHRAPAPRGPADQPHLAGGDQVAAPGQEVRAAKGACPGFLGRWGARTQGLRARVGARRGVLMHP